MTTPQQMGGGDQAADPAPPAVSGNAMAARISDADPVQHGVYQLGGRMVHAKPGGPGTYAVTDMGDA
jgi:hypothetical protein